MLLITTDATVRVISAAGVANVAVADSCRARVAVVAIVAVAVAVFLAISHEQEYASPKEAVRLQDED